jgi:hypothetical protein
MAKIIYSKRDAMYRRRPDKIMTDDDRGISFEPVKPHPAGFQQREWMVIQVSMFDLNCAEPWRHKQALTLRQLSGRCRHEASFGAQRSVANDPKENSRAFAPSIALTEMNAAVWGIAASECRAAWTQCPRGSRLCPLPFSFAHSPKT